MKLFLRAILLSIVAVGPLTAGGTSYSAPGIGTVVFIPNIRSVGIGGVFIAFPSAQAVNLSNPAGLIGLPYTVFEGGLFIEGINASSKAGEDYSSSANLSHFQVGIPMGQKFAMGFGGNRFTRVHYDYQIKSALGGFDNSQTVEGSGGFQMLSAAFAMQVTPELSLGITYQYMLGSTDRLWSVKFDDEAFSSTSDNLEENLRGSRVTLGATYQYKKYVFGAYLAKSYGFSSDVTLQQTFNDTSSTVSQSLHFPIQVGLGLSYTIAPYTVAGADLVYTKWNDFNFQSGQGGRLRNTIKVGVGIEKSPEKLHIEQWWKKLTYRAGAYFQNLYASNASGEFANEYVLSMGLGIPIHRRNQIDVGLEIGTRGTVATNKVKDTILRLTLGVSIGERWFLGRKKRATSN